MEAATPRSIERSMPLIATDKIVRELLSRHRAGVFIRRARHDIVVASSGRWGERLGLAVALEHQLHHEPDARMPAHRSDPAAKAAWARGQLELLTTDELLARLQHRAGPWVLGLSREGRRDRRLSFCSLWRGDSMLCAGLASRLAWQIAHHSVLHRLNHSDQPPSAKAATEELLAMLAHAVEQGYAQTAWVSGMARLLEHAMRAAAHEARLR